METWSSSKANTASRSWDHWKVGVNLVVLCKIDWLFYACAIAWLHADNLRRQWFTLILETNCIRQPSRSLAHIISHWHPWHPWAHLEGLYNYTDLKIVMHAFENGPASSQVSNHKVAKLISHNHLLFQGNYFVVKTTILWCKCNCKNETGRKLYLLHKNVQWGLWT